jgi:hypothetical protein
MEVVWYDDDEDDWWFGFRGRGGLRVDCPWQILVGGRLTRASGDHGQKSGLPAPADAAAEATDLLAGRAVQDVAVDPATGDLMVKFDGAITLRTSARVGARVAGRAVEQAVEVFLRADARAAVRSSARARSRSIFSSLPRLAGTLSSVPSTVIFVPSGSTKLTVATKIGWTNQRVRFQYRGE